MIYCSLDQALQTTGYAIFDDEKIVTYGTFKTKNTDPIEKRLGSIWQELNKLMNKYEFEYDCYDSCPTGYIPNDDNICEIQIIPSTETDTSIQTEKISTDNRRSDTEVSINENNYISSDIESSTDENNKENTNTQSSEESKGNTIISNLNERTNTNKLINEISNAINSYNDLNNLETYIERINGTIKEQIIHTHFPTYIYFNDNELFYDNSNLFSGLKTQKYLIKFKTILKFIQHQNQKILFSKVNQISFTK